MNSMTGFGRSISTVNDLECTMEIKSVNARFLDLTIRAPKQLNSVEHIIRRIIQSHIHRGKVEVYISLNDAGDRKKEINIHSALKEQIKQLLVDEGFYNDLHNVPLSAVMAISHEWIDIQEEELSQSVLEELVSNVTIEAVKALQKMRYNEGVHIQEDVLNRINMMATIIDEIDNKKEDAVSAYKLHLENKIRETISVLEKSFSDDRILQEIAIISDKTDITEEIVRFRSHVVQLKNTLMKPDAIGRKLDFIIQEMNREVNTIGSKAMDIELTDRVVQLKCELEKIREQVQNIE